MRIKEESKLAEMADPTSMKKMKVPQLRVVENVSNYEPGVRSWNQVIALDFAWGALRLLEMLLLFQRMLKVSNKIARINVLNVPNVCNNTRPTSFKVKCSKLSIETLEKGVKHV